MDINQVADFANDLSVATGNQPEAITHARIYREGLAEGVSHYVNPHPVHTDYIWFDPVGRVGVTNLLDVDAEPLGAIQGTNIIGTSKPLSPELDPSVSFPWDLIPYDRTTVARLILVAWMKVPGNGRLYSKEPFGSSIWTAEHTGAFDFAFMKVRESGEIVGRANLNLMDGENRNSILRLLKEMHHGRFIRPKEGELYLSDNLEPSKL